MMLAIFCRAENNRYYLEKNCYIKPGYLGKWIEFTAFDMEADTAKHIVANRWSKIKEKAL